MLLESEYRMFVNLFRLIWLLINAVSLDVVWFWNNESVCLELNETFTWSEKLWGLLAITWDLFKVRTFLVMCVELFHISIFELLFLFRLVYKYVDFWWSLNDKFGRCEWYMKVFVIQLHSWPYGIDSFLALLISAGELEYRISRLIAQQSSFWVSTSWWVS